MSPRGVTFELERFSASPVTADVVLLELEGRLAGAPARAATRLLVEPAIGARREHAPVGAVMLDGLLRASFAVPAADVEGSALALAVGGRLLELPAPDPVSAADRTVVLAREVNALRHELTVMLEEVAAGREAAAGHAAERERQAELARAAAKRQGELERATTELERELADVTAAAEQRDDVAAAQCARLEKEHDTARAAAVAASERAAELSREKKAARAELEALRRALDEREGELSAAAPRTRAVAASVANPEGAVAVDDVTTAALAVDDDDTTLERPADDDTTLERTGDDDTTLERPADDDDAVEPPDDTGPTPLRRAPVRRGSVVPTPEGGSQSERVRVLGHDRPRASALPPPPDADLGPPPGPSPRALAIAALVLAALLVIVAVLGFLL